LERSGMWYEAKRRWELLIERLPEDEEALLSLADHYTAEGLRYKDMTSGIITLMNFGIKDLNQAILYLSTLRKTRNGQRTAEMRLAELSVALGNWEEAVRYAKTLELFSEYPQAKAVLGTALFRMADREGAAKAFAGFLDVVPDSTKRLYNDPSFFFESRVLYLAGDAEPEDEDAALWEERNPRLLTVENERLLEHYARLTIASIRLSSRPGMWDGWRTEPGVLLIRYGEPRAQSRVRPELGDHGGVQHEELQWHYNDMTVVFKDYMQSRNYQLAGGWVDEPASYLRVVHELKRAKERYDPHRGRSPLAIDWATWLLPRDNATLAVVATDVPRNELELVWTEDEGAEAYIKRAVRWRGPGGQPALLDTAAFFLTPLEARGCPYGRVFSLAKYDSISIGVWDLTLEVEDGLSGRWTRYDTVFAIEKPPDRGPTLAGPIPCWKTGQVLEAQISLEHSMLLPTAVPVYSPNDTLVIYFEIHDLAQTVRGRHHGRIGYTVKQETKVPWWSKLVGRRRAFRISRLALELPEADPGDYEFLLTCLDELTGQHVKGTIRLLVCGNEEVDLGIEGLRD
jgi:GWxTD domain-containing protein